MAVRVKKDSIKINQDGIAVVAAFIANETVGTILIRDGSGKTIEPPHCRFRLDGDSRQIRTADDIFFPDADYKKMFKMAGAILGKKRKASAN